MPAGQLLGVGRLGTPCDTLMSESDDLYQVWLVMSQALWLFA